VEANRVNVTAPLAPTSEQAPVPVAIVAPDPIPVVMANDPRTSPGPGHPFIQRQSTDPSLPAVTTFQEDLTTAGQRRINLIWEFTQAAVTILITIGALYCAIWGIDADVLNFAFVAVISTYYARTNHTKIGGIKYEGR
jgi:hypothetical protein